MSTDTVQKLDEASMQERTTKRWRPKLRAGSPVMKALRLRRYINRTRPYGIPTSSQAAELNKLAAEVEARYVASNKSRKLT